VVPLSIFGPCGSPPQFWVHECVGQGGDSPHLPTYDFNVENACLPWTREEFVQTG
jgi:hypothetical protein